MKTDAKKLEAQYSALYKLEVEPVEYEFNIPYVCRTDRNGDGSSSLDLHVVEEEISLAAARVWQGDIAAPLRADHQFEDNAVRYLRAEAKRRGLRKEFEQLCAEHFERFDGDPDV